MQWWEIYRWLRGTSIFLYNSLCPSLSGGEVRCGPTAAAATEKCDSAAVIGWNLGVVVQAVIGWNWAAVIGRMDGSAALGWRKWAALIGCLGVIGCEGEDEIDWAGLGVIGWVKEGVIGWVEEGVIGVNEGGEEDWGGGLGSCLLFWFWSNLDNFDKLIRSYSILCNWGGNLFSLFLFFCKVFPA